MDKALGEEKLAPFLAQLQAAGSDEHSDAERYACHADHELRKRFFLQNRNTS